MVTMATTTICDAVPVISQGNYLYWYVCIWLLEWLNGGLLDWAFSILVQLSLPQVTWLPCTHLWGLGAAASSQEVPVISYALQHKRHYLFA